jgi:phosphoglycerol transferase MdoB-like AlkP superfamily enzyme
MFKNKSPFLYLLVFSLLVNLILRIILISHPITQTNFEVLEIIKIFSLGLLSDFFVFTIASVFLWLYLQFLSDSKYNKPFGYILFGILLLTFFYIISGKSILDEYGGVIPLVAGIFIGLKLFLFGLFLFFKNIRAKLRLILYSITIFIYVLLIIQNAVSEYFFWNEFGVRYNFIAVDYLIYTNEVIRNIIESYPIVPLVSIILIISIAFTYLIVKKTKVYFNNLPKLNEKIKTSILYSVLFILSILFLPFLSKNQNSDNQFANELQSSGLYKFYIAFTNSELDYDKFYKTIPNDEAFAILKNQIPEISNSSTLRTIKGNDPEIRKNIVLITVESFSAEFLTNYGNKLKITPFLDSLATKSLFFSNLYATGNRTVRGLESVTLCLPPSPGESIVKRKDNNNKFSTNSILQSKGYSSKFFYGGNAYFDNMDDFFIGNNYKVVDKSSFKPNEISFSNVWGVCDEDMAKKIIQNVTADSQNKKPFFAHWMTVSNHRPFSFPEGKIDIPNSFVCREAVVKYTDFALKQFFKMSEKQSWFDDTIFVIVADHCASSSGKTELPLDRYRIPAFVYAPKFIEPRIYNQLVSQIDLMPTVFGLLNFNYESKFYGQDVLKTDYKPRAFIATYQDLGLIKDNVLTIVSPKQKVKQYQLNLVKNTQPDDYNLFYHQKLITKPRTDLINETISYYQTTAKLLKDKKMNK